MVKIFESTGPRITFEEIAQARKYLIRFIDDLESMDRRTVAALPLSALSRSDKPVVKINSNLLVISHPYLHIDGGFRDSKRVTVDQMNHVYNQLDKIYTEMKHADLKEISADDSCSGKYVIYFDKGCFDLTRPYEYLDRMFI